MASLYASGDPRLRRRGREPEASWPVSRPERGRDPPADRSAASFDFLQQQRRHQEPSISLSEQQLQLLAQKQQQRSKTQPSVTRSNQEDDKGKDQIRESKNSSSERVLGGIRAPTRTPNPVSRSDFSGRKSDASTTDSPQKALLRQMLEKAKNTSTSSSSLEGKASLKKVLAQKFASRHRDKQQQTAPSLRSRLRRVREQVKNNSLSPSSKDNEAAEERTKGAAFQQVQAKAKHVRRGLDDSIQKTATEQKKSISNTSAARITEIPQRLAVQPIISSPKQYPALQKRLSEDDNRTCPSDEDDEEPEGYAEFLEILRTEVPQQHSQVWSSFQAVMKGQPVPPPCIVQPSPKAIKFDKATVDQLSIMHAYLKKHTAVECMSSTQVVNDKKIAKELLAEAAEAARAVKEQEERAPADTGTSPTLEQSRSHDPILQARSSSSLSTMSRQDPRSTRRREDDVILQMRSSGDETADELRTARKMNALTDTLSEDTGEKIASPAGTADLDESTSNPGLEVTLGQFEYRAVSSGKELTKDLPASPTWSTTTAGASFASSSTTPWAGIELNSTSSEDASASTAAGVQTKPSTTSIESSSLGPWSNVKLRPVAIPEEEEENRANENSQSAEEDSMQQQQSSPSVIDLTSMSSSSLSRKLRSKDEKDTRLATTGPEKRLSEETTTRRTTVADKHPTGEKIDEAVAIPLKDETGVSDTQVSRIVLGKKVLMVVRSEVGDPRAQVIWKLPRNKVDSLSLDMATLSVNLILVKGGEAYTKNKVLSFSRSEECLKFANAFYETSLESTLDAGVADSHTVDESMQLSSFDSVLVESLNEEEQAVLETYRRLRREKGAQAALAESVSLDTARSETTKTKSSAPALINAEEEIARKYRKMLKMGIPLEAVEHKMKRDQVDDNVVAVIRSEAKLPPSNEPPRFVAANVPPTSPISAMSASVALSIEEAQVAEDYKRMLRSKVEPDEVRRKMEMDRVDPKIMAIVLGDDGSTTASTQESTNLSEEENRAVLSYKKMLRMGFPEEVVRHRMKKEQVDEKIVAAVFGLEPTKGANEVIAEKYRKMLKLGMEKGAVRHKMLRDQVDPKIMLEVIGAEEEEPIATEQSRPSSTARRKGQANSVLSDEEESVASSYRKMLKLQIPRDRVLSRMQQEGVSDKIITAVVGNQLTGPKTNEKLKDSSAPGSKLVSLHWTPLSGKELDNSVWRSTSKASEAHPEGADISKLIALFQKKTNAVKRKDKKADDTSGGSGKAKLLDLTRSNNIAISLKAFKDFSHKELAEAIAFLDPLRKIRGERVQFIRDLLPTAAEIKAIRSYKGSDDRLVPAELWFRRIVDIKRCEAKVQVMQTMETFQPEVESLCDSFGLLSKVCNQAMDSEKLQVLLGMVLQIGNIMNEGTRTGGAAGFKFDSLLRLTQTKSSDGKTTVLDFLVTVFVEKGQRQTLDLLSDFPECHNASRMVIGDLVGQVKDTKESLKKCKEELEALKVDANGGKTKRVEDDAVSTSTVAGNSNVALMAAILARGKQESQAALEPLKAKPEGFAKRDQFLAALKETQSKASTPGESVVQAETGGDVESKLPAANSKKEKQTCDTARNSIDGGIARLGQFVCDAEKIFDRLEASRADALDCCRELSRYCGESGGTGATSTLLSILAEFASNLGDAMKKYDAKQEAENRKMRRKGDGTAVSDLNSESNPNPSSAEANERDDSLVLMVNDMLKDANDRTKEDFKKGRTYHDPSSKLRAIYEREKNVAGIASPNIRRKLDIVSAIKEQEGNIDQAEVQKARSQFANVYLDAVNSCRKADLVESDHQAHNEPHWSAEDESDDSIVAATCGVQHARALFEDMVRRPCNGTANKSPDAKEESSVSVEKPTGADDNVAGGSSKTGKSPDAKEESSVSVEKPTGADDNVAGGSSKTGANKDMENGSIVCNADAKIMCSKLANVSQRAATLFCNGGTDSNSGESALQEKSTPNRKHDTLTTPVLDKDNLSLTVDPSTPIQSVSNPSEDSKSSTPGAITSQKLSLREDSPSHTMDRPPSVNADSEVEREEVAHQLSEKTTVDADNVQQTDEQIGLGSPKRPDGERQDSVSKLSDARKKRSMFENMLSRNPSHSSTKESAENSKFDTSESEKRLQCNGIETPERKTLRRLSAPLRRGMSSIFDTSASKRRLNDEPVGSPDRRKSFGIRATKSLDVPPERKDSLPVTASSFDKPVSERRKSLTELAREKRAEKSTRLQETNKTTTSEREALVDVTLPNHKPASMLSSVENSKESSIIRMARLKHHEESEKCRPLSFSSVPEAQTLPLSESEESLNNESTEQRHSISLPASEQPRGQSLWDMARKKREEKGVSKLDA